MTNSTLMASSLQADSSPIHIGIVIYPDAEVLDFAGPYEVFTTAVRVHGFPWQVSLVAEHSPVNARAGFSVNADTTFDASASYDIVIVVGGDHTRELANTVLLRWLKEATATAKIIGSVCTGAFLLAEAGVIQQAHVTTHWEDIPALKQRFPALTVHEDCRVVNHGNKYSSGGISAGIDMALTLVADLTCVESARLTARQMEYRWDERCLRKGSE